MEVFAIYRNANSSQQKVRLVLDLIRGRSAIKALEILNFIQKKSAFLIRKVLYSAISNARNNYKLDVKKLRIKKIFSGKGSTLKRLVPRAKGKADYISKVKCHITVILTDE